VNYLEVPMHMLTLTMHAGRLMKLTGIGQSLSGNVTWTDTGCLETQ